MYRYQFIWKVFSDEKILILKDEKKILTEGFFILGFVFCMKQKKNKTKKPRSNYYEFKPSKIKF